jgi:hypothetical protein
MGNRPQWATLHDDGQHFTTDNTSRQATLDDGQLCRKKRRHIAIIPVTREASVSSLNMQFWARRTRRVRYPNRAKKRAKKGQLFHRSYFAKRLSLATLQLRLAGLANSITV